MRLARKLFLVAVMALATLALAATTANAQVPVEVFGEHVDPENDAHCATLSKVGHVVAGGCHFEIEGEHHIPVIAQTAGGPVPVFICNWHLEARLGEDGVGWVTGMQLTPESPPGTTPTCTRAACDEAGMTQIPWPISMVETAGVTTVEFTFCLRTIASGEGGAGTHCEVHLPLSDNGNHQYELGNEDTYTCENLPQVSIGEVHLVNEVQGVGEPKEDIEIIH